MYQPPAKDRTVPILLTVVGVVLVLCVGGGTAAALVLRSQDTEPAAVVVAPPPTAAPTPSPARTVTIVEPKTLGGRPRAHDGDLEETAEMLKARISGPADTNSVSAAYGKPGTRNVVLMAAAAAPIALPQQNVAGTLSSFGGTGAGVTGIVNVPAGALGGSATCGNALVANQKAAVCVWADDGSIGLMVFPRRSVAEVAGEFPGLRAEIERVS
jgi:hypothetical protein